MALRIQQTSMKGARSLKLDRRGELHLSAQETTRLSGVDAGDAIVSTQGILWITQEGDLQDYMLHKGERFVAEKRGVVVVQAMTDAAYSFSKN